jgi:hypothetical protein
MYSTIGSIQKKQAVTRQPEHFSNAPKIYQSGTVYGTHISQITKKSGPALWGRPFWFSLHFGALNYPDSPNNEMIEMSVGFIKGIPVMLPCDICKNHASEYIYKRRNALRKIASSKENLFKFYWEFHNEVNRQNMKKEISLSEAYDIFQNRPEEAL